MSSLVCLSVDSSAMGHQTLTVFNFLTVSDIISSPIVPISSFWICLLVYFAFPGAVSTSLWSSESPPWTRYWSRWRKLPSFSGATTLGPWLSSLPSSRWSWRDIFYAAQSLIVSTMLVNSSRFWCICFILSESKVFLISWRSCLNEAKSAGALHWWFIWCYELTCFVSAPSFSVRFE